MGKVPNPSNSECEGTSPGIVNPYIYFPNFFLETVYASLAMVFIAKLITQWPERNPMDCNKY
jgi:hypothetical protein